MGEEEKKSCKFPIVGFILSSLYNFFKKKYEENEAFVQKLIESISEGLIRQGFLKCVFRAGVYLSVLKEMLRGWGTWAGVEGGREGGNRNLGAAQNLPCKLGAERSLKSLRVLFHWCIHITS